MLADLSFEVNNLHKLNSQLKADNEELREQIKSLQFVIETKKLTQTTFGSIKLVDESYFTNTESLKIHKSENSERYEKRIVDLQTEVNNKQAIANAYEIENQKLISLYYKLEKKYTDLQADLKKHEYLTKESETMKHENRELNHYITQILCENSCLTKEINSCKSTSRFDEIFRTQSLSKSDGTQVRPTYIDKLIKENSELKLKILKNKCEKKDTQNSDIDDALRYEKKRNKKRDAKEGELIKMQSSSSIPQFYDHEKVQSLEKAKIKLENELINKATEWNDEKINYEVQINALKDRLESAAKNYKLLQELIDSTAHIIDSKSELEKIALQKEYNMLESKFSDLNYKQLELTKDLEMDKKTIDYFKSELKKSREEYQTLLNLQMRTQSKLLDAENPNLDNDHPHAIESKRLNLKIEGLTLINSQLNQLVVDSKKVAQIIQMTCVQEIDKFTEGIRHFILAHNLTSSSPQEGEGRGLPGKPYDEVLVENSQLRTLVEEYNQMMEQMKDQINELSTNMDESRCKMELHSSEERKNEKEFFLKIIKDFEQQRGTNLEELEKQCAMNLTLKSQLEQISIENEKLTKKQSLVKSQLDTMENVMNEQIKKKKELFNENKNLKSKLSMLESKVDQMTSKLNEMMSNYNTDQKVVENQNLTDQVKQLQKLTEQYEEEIKVLKSENTLLYRNLEALNASAVSENADVDMQITADNADLELQESKDLDHLNSVVNKCIDKIMATTSTSEDNFDIKTVKSEVANTFADLKKAQSKINDLVKVCQKYKLKLQESEKQYLLLKSSSSETVLYKQQLDEFIAAQRDGKYFNDSTESASGKGKVFNKMWDLLKKYHKVCAIQQQQTEDQK